MKLFFPGSPVPPDSPAYVERPADIKARYLALKGTPVYISGPPLAGKTSLLFRLGFLLLSQDFSFSYMRLEPGLWPGELENFLSYSLRASGKNVLLVDHLEHGGEEAFAMLGRWLRTHPGTPLVASGTFFPYPGEISPFVELAIGFFYRPHILQLVTLLGLKGEEARQTAAEIYRWSGGYPYIVQSLCAALAEGRSLKEAIEDFPRQDRELVPMIRKALQEVPEAFELYHRILAGEQLSYRRITSLFRKAPTLRALFRSDEKGFVRLSSPLLSEL